MFYLLGVLTYFCILLCFSATKCGVLLQVDGPGGSLVNRTYVLVMKKNPQKKLQASINHHSFLHVVLYRLIVTSNLQFHDGYVD
jgi:hypothetical protein